MTTMTMEPIIKTAMNKIGLEEKTDELLEMMDKIELDMNLELSWQEYERGEHEDVFEALAEIKKEIRNER
jgi:exonuclease VII small subunit